MLFISIGLQIVAINQKYKCDVQKSLICVNVENNCEIFMETKGQSNYTQCCPNVDCVCEDYSKYYFGCNFLYKEESIVSLNTIKLIILGFFATGLVTGSIFYVRRVFLKRMDLTMQEIAAIDTGTRGFRNKFPNEKQEFREAEMKLLAYNGNDAEYNKIIIRGIDFFGRKTFHFFSVMVFVYAPVIFLKGNPLPSFYGIIVYSLLELCLAYIVWCWIYIPVQYRPYIAPFLFGGHNRIHDRYGTHANIITALSVGTVRTLSTSAFYIYVQKDILYDLGTNMYEDFDSIRRLFILVWILSNNGVAFGDTAGEGVGAFLGKHRFKVRGFLGQENERSAEGCFAVFLFTTVSNVMAVAFCSDLFSKYTLETIGLVLILGFGTMVFESLSFKGTDNLIICLFCQTTIFIWTSLMRDGYL
tara:strand:+ start:5046 stop:6290 length:1245 start_codon:yes stop_codon:yes gene_type:complete